MKRNLLILFVACLALNVNAQLLWKVSGKGLSKPSYILGTHHLAPLSIIDSIKGLQTAFDATTQIIGELNMSEVQTPAAMQLMQQKMMIENDTTLQVLFTPEQYAKINNFTKENLGFDLSQMPKVKPAFIDNNAVVILYMKHVGNFKPQEQLDTYFQTKALEKGKKVGALETLDFQLNLLYNSMSLRRQAELLLCELSDVDKLINNAKELTSAYMNQELDTMYEISLEKNGAPCDPLPREMDAIISNRNKAWSTKLPALMTVEPTFVVVGALHLPGEEGLLNLLKKQGYTLQAVR